MYFFKKKNLPHTKEAMGVASSVCGRKRPERGMRKTMSLDASLLKSNHWVFVEVFFPHKLLLMCLNQQHFLHIHSLSKNNIKIKTNSTVIWFIHSWSIPDDQHTFAHYIKTWQAHHKICSISNQGCCLSTMHVLGTLLEQATWTETKNPLGNHFTSSSVPCIMSHWLPTLEWKHKRQVLR